MQDHEDSPRRKRKRRKRRHKEDIFNIPGVRKIILTELTQKIIECVAGEHVSSESPWKYVKKEVVQDNLELHEESSEFLPIRNEILAYPRDRILIGFIADETQDREDEFYICVTEEATDAVQKIIERLKQEQEYRLHYQLYKDIYPWLLGRRPLLLSLDVSPTRVVVLSVVDKQPQQKRVLKMPTTHVGETSRESNNGRWPNNPKTTQSLDDGSESLSQFMFYVKIRHWVEYEISALVDVEYKKKPGNFHLSFKRRSMGTDQEVDEAIVKNTRPLLEVEVETQYPIFPGKVQFRILTAEQKRDGYMELKCGPDEHLVNVYMRRIDSSVQVAPEVVSTEAQTICTYPKNSATQYLYDTDKPEELLLKCESQILRHASEQFENLSDLLRVNGAIDFYADDFDSLATNSLTQVGRVLAKEFIEYMFFMDVNLCKGKMISDVYWHQMWTGTIAIAYSNIAPNIYYSGPNKEDEVYKAVHENNLVLIWCFNDGLKPKLILESPREIYRVSFCKFDENILIGGCKNGQIVIWDIRNKLQKVEEKEVLTVAQQKYRNYMYSLMGWMKNIHDISIVRPAAVSDLRCSHKAAVTGINWMDPRFEFSRTGNLIEIDQEDEERKDKLSMQFISSSLDGTLLIWDLKKKPTLTPGSYKPKKLKRLKKRPSALEVDISPYRALHLNLKPIYKINVMKPNQKNRPVAITRSSSAFCWLNYEQVNPDKTKKFDIKERIIYRPVMKTPSTSEQIKPVMRFGTIEGDYAYIHWEGQDFDSGETVNSEVAKYNFCAKYHDGPINSIHTSKTNMATLTVGGKIFCIWRKELPDRPILWRRCRMMFTKGEWSTFQSYKIVLHSLSGITQKWILSAFSKGPFFKQVMSTGFLTSSGIHPFEKEKNLYGIGDEQGAFRLFYLPFTAAAATEYETKNMQDFINREINRKKLFYKWQDDFNKRNEGYLLRMKYEASERAKEEADKEKEKSNEKVSEKAVRKGPQPGKYVEWIKEQRLLTEEARIKAMIINKKQLDTKELEKRRKPLQKLDEENERKKRKQKERLKHGENIFRETVASLFPDVMKEKPVPPPDPYAGGDPTEDRERCYTEYLKSVKASEDFIYENPFTYEFSFKNLIVESRITDIHYTHPHAKRYEAEKKERRGSIASDTERSEEEESGIQEKETLDENGELTEQPVDTV